MNNIVYPAKLDTLYRAIDYRQSQHDLPLIGISANFENGNSCIEHSYVISILQAGAIPVLLPVHNDIETLRKTIETLDGLMLTGGWILIRCTGTRSLSPRSEVLMPPEINSISRW